MRFVTVTAFALAAAVILTLRTALAPVPLPEPRIPGVEPTENPVIERVLSFDANGDGRVAAEEIVERMRGLVWAEDANGDGSLDQAEIRGAMRARELLFALERRAPRSNHVTGKPVPTVADIVRDLRLPPPIYAQVVAVAVLYPHALTSETDRARLMNALERILTGEERENLDAALARAGPPRVG